MAEAVVLYPSPHIGHLISMVELGKLILRHLPSITIHVIITTPPYNQNDTVSYISSVSSTSPEIVFHRLPAISLPPSFLSSATHPENLTFQVIRLNKPHLRRSLLSISADFSVRALFIDLFCGLAFDVPSELRIPTLFFFTSGAACLVSFLRLPAVHRSTVESLRDLRTLLEFPGLPPVPPSDMPKPLLDRHNMAYDCFLECSVNLAKSAGIVVNTFEALEPRPIEALRDGLCVDDGPTPPIYSVGPLIFGAGARRSNGGDRPECLDWLDSQPEKSVVFLCFGSMGLFSAEQLKEIALGLERSGQRFLWVVRSPPSENPSLAAASAQEQGPSLNSLLPEGFLERTKERGLVVEKWAPQVAILNHESLGGFVTHCGWNSVLEAVCGGVPMVAWPLYAEQRFNRVVMVEEMKIALWMTESEEDGSVSSDEVERRVRELMESEIGESIRKRVMVLKNQAEAALSRGGSSLVALNRLFESWKRR